MAIASSARPLPYASKDRNGLPTGSTAPTRALDCCFDAPFMEHAGPLAITSLLVCLALTGCGDTGTEALAVPAGPDGSAAGSAAVAVRPSGPTARNISHICRSGRDDTIVVNIFDLADLAKTLNAIQPCEYDQGVMRATVTLACSSQPLVVQLTAAEGNVRQPARRSLCP